MGVCSVCLDETPKDNSGVPDGCTHRFCLPCILQWAEQATVCPLCKARFKGVRKTSDGAYFTVIQRDLAPAPAEVAFSAEDFYGLNPDEYESDFVVGDDEVEYMPVDEQEDRFPSRGFLSPPRASTVVGSRVLRATRERTSHYRSNVADRYRFHQSRQSRIGRTLHSPPSAMRLQRSCRASPPDHYSRAASSSSTVELRRSMRQMQQDRSLLRPRGQNTERHRRETTLKESRTETMFLDDEAVESDRESSGGEWEVESDDSYCEDSMFMERPLTDDSDDEDFCDSEDDDSSASMVDSFGSECSVDEEDAVKGKAEVAPVPSSQRNSRRYTMNWADVSPSPPAYRSTRTRTRRLNEQRQGEVTVINLISPSPSPVASRSPSAKAHAREVINLITPSPSPVSERFSSASSSSSSSSAIVVVHAQPRLDIPAALRRQRGDQQRRFAIERREGHTINIVNGSFSSSEKQEQSDSEWSKENNPANPASKVTGSNNVTVTAPKRRKRAPLHIRRRVIDDSPM